MKYTALTILFLFLGLGWAQAQFDPSKAQVHGNFQIDAQTYQVDNEIGLTETDINGKKSGLNGFGNITYRYGDFSAGLRYESYLPPLNGFDQQYEGQGIANRYLKYSGDQFEITVGNFYDQFGNGLVFRSYEEWTLGYDNSMDGVHVKLRPADGITLKGIYGTQRHYWNDYEDGNRGIVKGVDLDVNLNYLFQALKTSKTRIQLGGSFVSKYEKDNPFSDYKLPENVGSYAARASLRRGKWSLQAEYAYKINDPNSLNNFIFKDGEALWLSATYTQRGLGVILSAKRIDNFAFTSMRNPSEGRAPDINFLPPLAYQHTYTLPAMYPYNTQPNGEMGVSGEVFYNIERKTALGGKYGTKLSAYYSLIHGLDKSPVEGQTEVNIPGTDGYESDFFKFGDIKFYRDLSFKMEKKVDKDFKFIAGYTWLDYNMEVIEEEIEQGEHFYESHTGFLDMTYKIDPKKALRLELQYMSTQQDSGNWALAMVEYSVAPKWFFTVQDQYNFNNPESDNTYHYYTFGVAYAREATRISVSYGRQREGILCVGGVCRQVPASSGFNLTITSSF
ncbi:MAG TPA: DUF6029 family protein [Bacteroidales bacterium]|nr:DUF6029 family protein [Bacteroidales bacterium]